MALRQHVHDLTHEFVPPHVKCDGTDVVPVNATQLHCTSEPLDRYSSELENLSHKLEDVTTMTLELPLYDLAHARRPEDRAAAGAHIQHGLVAVRGILDNDLGQQDEYNEADVITRLRGALLQIEALPDVKK